MNDLCATTNFADANFVVIDFETANHSRVSICAAGMAIFENGVLTESLYWLVRPPKGHGWFQEDFIECHGLTHLDVVDAPDFPAIAPEFLSRLERADFVVAHNAQFDIGHLYETLTFFGLACPSFNYLCTRKLARQIWPELPNHRLDTLAEQIALKFNHHNARADAETAGHVLLAMMKQIKTTLLAELLQNTSTVPGRYHPQKSIYVRQRTE